MFKVIVAAENVLVLKEVLKESFYYEFFEQLYIIKKL